jgi:glycine C-acetyltransferase/8-amino-7-oxononanoate synthase
MTDPGAALADLRRAGLLRELREVQSAQGPRVRLDGREVLLLCSNDYLGLAEDPRVRDAAARGAQEWGAGAAASRLVSGNMTPHRELEAVLAELSMPVKELSKTL